MVHRGGLLFPASVVIVDDVLFIANLALPLTRLWAMSWKRTLPAARTLTTTPVRQGHWSKKRA